MEKRNKGVCLLLLAVVMLLAGCRSTKNATDKDTDAKVETLKLATDVSDAVSAKMKLTLLPEGEKPLSLSGTFNAKKDEGAQIIITPLGLLEAFRVDFLPAQLVVANKLKAEYTSIDYSSFGSLDGLFYSVFEAFFLNNIVVPQGSSINEELNKMIVAHENDKIVLAQDVKGIKFIYYVSELTGRIVKSVCEYGGSSFVTCTYGDFQPVGDKQFPSQMELTLQMGGKMMSLSFALSRMKELSVFEPTKLTSAYKKVTNKNITDLLQGK